ncbi:MAG: ABC transporter permease [bacterium]|nr:ABC transporter permease [bacterium]
MIGYVIRRTIQAVAVVWIVATLVFAMIHLAGDPVAVLAPEQMSQQARQELRRELGLDRPLYVQYARYLDGVAHGDLGISYYTDQPAMRLVVGRLHVTAELVLCSMAIALLFGLPFGVLSAVYPGGAIDRALRVVSALGSSVPTFFLGIVLILLFSVEVSLLPSSGLGSWRNFVLPAFTLAFYRIALFTRLIRTTLLDELSNDYVRTARAKGLAETTVVMRHALRNALLPFVTVFGLQFGQLLGGAVITETIFALPGMNRLALDAMLRLDYPIILSYVIVVAAIFSFINLVVDLVYGLVDPRVRYEA